MQDLFHDWNGGGCPGALGNAVVLDETLRDGIQSPSAIDPHLDAKVELLHLLDALGVDQLDVGLPGAGAHQRAAIKRLADRIYSGVPAGEFGKEQQIEIGPMSGLSNVKHWLARHEIPADEPLAKAILQQAKAGNRTLTESEVAQLVRDLRSEARS